MPARELQVLGYEARTGVDLYLAVVYIGCRVVGDDASRDQRSSHAAPHKLVHQRFQLVELDLVLV